MRKNTKVTPVLMLLLAFSVVSGQRSLAQDHVPDLGEFHFSGDAVVLSLLEERLHPKVNIVVGDGELYEFIVDTGASVNIIDSSIAESQGYEVIGEMEIGAPGGPQIPANIVKVPVIQVGSATIRDSEFVTMDIIGFSGGQTHGVIGVGTFRDYLVTFDLGGGEITVSNASLSADEPGVLRYNPANGQIEIELDVQGTLVASHIDTGSMGTFMLPAELMRSLPLSEAAQPPTKARLVGGERDIKFAKLDGTIQFAGFSYENPNIAFMDPSPGSGNIGGRVLDDYLMSIDQTNHLIQFRKPAHRVAASTDTSPRRLGVGFRGMPGGSILTISSVEPDSLAEKAGLLAGDVLMSLNGISTEQYNMSELGALFASSTLLVFDIARDGVSQTIEIP